MSRSYRSRHHGSRFSPRSQRSLLGSGSPLLQISDLTVEFQTRKGAFCAVDKVSFQVNKGETLGVVGESGCGKSVTAQAIAGLLPEPPECQVSGNIRFHNQELLEQSREAMEAIRGEDISMIFPDPTASLNPLQSIGRQLIETIHLHAAGGSGDARYRAVDVLRRVGISDPESRIKDYPQQMSAGMLQRVMIAMALFSQPKLLIADEPTSTLDVTIQAQILDLLRSLTREAGTSVILITHDLAVVAELAQRVVVMYAGVVVEEASLISLFRDPQHPYTLGLLGSIPRLHTDQERLVTIDGAVPDPYQLPDGCRFHPRCPFADEQCRQGQPPLSVIRPGHQVACWHAPVENSRR